MNRRQFIAVSGLVLAAGPALAQVPAGTTLDEVKKRGVVRVGVRQDVPGFGIVDEKEPPLASTLTSRPNSPTASV